MAVAFVNLLARGSLAVAVPVPVPVAVAETKRRFMKALNEKANEKTNIIKVTDCSMVSP